MARLARHHASWCVMMPCESYHLPRGDLIRHAAPPPNLPRFSCAYPILIRFSGAISEVFWNSKWVMRHIVGTLSMSTFQRYKVCVNRSSDGRVMASESWGAGVVFARFSSEDAGQSGKANGELRVPCRS